MPDFKKDRVEKKQQNFSKNVEPRIGNGEERNTERQIKPVETNRRSVDPTPNPSFEHPKGHVSAGFRGSVKQGVLSRTPNNAVFPSGDSQPRQPNGSTKPANLSRSTTKRSKLSGSTNEANVTRKGRLVKPNGRVRRRNP